MRGAFLLLAVLLSGAASALAEPFFESAPTSAFGHRKTAAAPRSLQVAMVSFQPPKRTELPAARQDEEEEASSSVVESSGSRPTVSGTRAVLRRGVAYAPAGAPENVKRAIWAVNTLRNKPYKWGGGHSSFRDSGYDCSGTVSFALHHAGLLGSPMPSRGFLDYGKRGKGRWITVYSRRGHVFAVIAGLRLDTTGFRDREGPRWRAEMRHPGGFRVTHPAGH